MIREAVQRTMAAVQFSRDRGGAVTPVDLTPPEGCSGVEFRQAIFDVASGLVEDDPGHGEVRETEAGHVLGNRRWKVTVEGEVRTIPKWSLG